MPEPPDEAELAALGLGAAVRVAAVPIGASVEELFAEEIACVARAVPKRQREFATGRTLARRLLGELGFPPAPLLPEADRTTRWPEGAVGSIAHTDEVCIVAVARSEVARSLGIDVEAETPLEADLVRLVCTERERAWLQDRQPAERGLLAKLVFSAKEAAYKCLFPLTGMMLDFQDAEIELKDGRFVVRWQPPEVAELGLGVTEGRYVLTGDWILAGARCRTE